MGLFEKKYCDLCGEKIGMLGNRKLEDGNCCKECAAKLSPWFSERRSSTVEEIRAHIAYREENEQRLGSVTPSRVLGNRTRVYIDEEKQVFFVTRFDNWQSRNPDIIGLDQVTSCQYEVNEHKSELYQKTADGKRERYNPPRYEYEYSFHITILVNSPWFNEIEFELSDDRPEQRFSDAYRILERQANEICNALDPERRKKAELGEKLKQALVQNLEQQKKAAEDGWFCPECGTHNTGNFCSNCGGKRPGGKYRCNKCGWVPDDPAHPPKFCPQCGDPFTEADRA